MEASRPNPVYDRLTHMVGWPSTRTTTWMGMGLILVSIATAAIRIVLQPGGAPSAGVEVLIPLMASSSLAIIGLGMGFALTTLVTARALAGDDFALLRLSRVSPFRVMRCFVDGARDRLGQLWTAALWAMPTAAVVSACAFAIQQALPGCSYYYPGGCGRLVWGFFGELAIMLPVAGLYVGKTWMLTRLAIEGGIWVGVRWGRAAPVATGMALVVSLMLTVLLGLLPLAIFLAGSLSCLLVSLAVDVAVMVTANDLAEKAHRGAVERLAAFMHVPIPE